MLYSLFNIGKNTNNNEIYKNVQLQKRNRNKAVLLKTALFFLFFNSLIAPLFSENSYTDYKKLKHIFESCVKGAALEKTARENYLAFNKNIISFSELATYNNGVNGLDGAFYKADEQGVIRSIYIQEVKSGNAKLSLKKRTPQMTKEWIIEGLEKCINGLNEQSSDFQKNKKLLETAKLMVAEDINVKRFIDRINIENGKIKIERTHIIADKDYSSIEPSKRNLHNVFEIKPPQLLDEIPILNITSKNLSSYQNKVKSELFTAITNAMTKAGFSKPVINKTLRELKTNAKITTKGSGKNALSTIAVQAEIKHRRLSGY